MQRERVVQENTVMVRLCAKKMLLYYGIGIGVFAVCVCVYACQCKCVRVRARGWVDGWVFVRARMCIYLRVAHYAQE